MMQFTEIPQPLVNESSADYARRLVMAGCEEMLIRSGLRQHFGLSLAELRAFFDDFPEARFRHFALIRALFPNQNEYAFQRKVSANLGLDADQATAWIARFEAWKREADDA
jgi:hypothetical protein